MPVPERVEATVEEIERYINAPAPARLGREVDEKDKPVALFGDPDSVRRLLGEEPRYVYIPSGEDPMIVPWVRDQVMAAELMIEAQQLYKEGKYEEALAKVRVVIEQFSRTDSLGKAQDLRKAIESEIVKPAESSGDAPKITAMKRKFPEWIEKNTSGVIYDESDPKLSKVLVGDFVLGMGDSVPSYAGIKVVHIEKSMVTFDFQGDLHQVPVEGGH